MADDHSRFCWQAVVHCAEVLPAGVLMGTGLALSRPQDHSVDTVIVVMLAVSGAILVLAYKPVLQAANFGQVAVLLALCCVAHRIFSRTHALQLTDEKLLLDELISCLREYAVMMACLGSAICMACPSPMQRPSVDPLPVEQRDPLASNAPSLCQYQDLGQSCDLSSQSDKLECISDVGSLPFRHVGPTSSYSEASEYSVLTLSSSGGRVDPVLAMSIFQLSMKMNAVMSTRDEDASSTEPQLEFN